MSEQGQKQWAEWSKQRTPRTLNSDWKPNATYLKYRDIIIQKECSGHDYKEYLEIEEKRKLKRLCIVSK